MTKAFISYLYAARAVTRGTDKCYHINHTVHWETYINTHKLNITSTNTYENLGTLKSIT